MNTIASRRFVNQLLSQATDSGPAVKQPADVVAYLAAMQAQEFAMAKWAIGLRLPSAQEKDVDEAFNNGQILRTHLLRPTWHFVASADIEWLLLLTAPRVKQVNAFMDRQCGLDAAIFKQTNDLLANALQGNKYLTRDELAILLNQEGIQASGPRLGQIMMRAELDGIICSGPRQGNQFTYALLSERAPDRRTLTRQEALAELANRYTTSRGPATLHDFSTWSGLTIREVTEAVVLAEPAIEKEYIDGQMYYVNRNQAAPSSVLPATFLMPDYDEYGMGYKNRSAIMHPQLTGRLAYNRMIVVDGTIAGSWKRTIKGNGVVLDLHANRPLTSQQREQVEAAAHRYARFIGKTVAGMTMH